MLTQLTTLTEGQVVTLHKAALQILKDTGMVVQSQKARDLVAQHGAVVDHNSQVVRFPERMVHDLIGMAPSFYTLGGRAPEHDLELNLTSGLTRPIVGCNRIYDPDTQRRRDVSTEDMVEATRLIDALPNYDWNAAFVYGGDEPPPTGDVYYFKLLLENTQKHICISPYGARNVEYMIEMALAVQGSEEEISRRPILNIPVSPATPLVYSEKFVDIIMILATARVPIMLGSTPIMGGTGPATVAGTAVLTHVENLVALMIAEATNPGAPVYYGPRPSPMDMRSGISLWGSIDWGTATLPSVQLARWCGLPADFSGLGTDSKLPDQQAGIEKGMMVVLAALSAASVISGGGYIDSITTGSFEQLVIDDELIAMARHMVRDIEVDAEHIALDLITKVGYGNAYLSEVHTRDHFRREFFQSQLLEQNTYGTWEKLGGKDMVTRARDQAGEILSKHEVPPLPDAVVRELETIMKAARREIVDA